MWSKNGPIPGQVVKVIHDDSYKQVDYLKQRHATRFGSFTERVYLSTEHSEMSKDYQKSTKHVEADKVDNGKAAATRPLLPWVVV